MNLNKGKFYVAAYMMASGLCIMVNPIYAFGHEKEVDSVEVAFLVSRLLHPQTV